MRALADALVGTIPPNRGDPRMRTYAQPLSALMSQCAAVRMTGSCNLGLAHLASGRLDAFWMAGLRPWDLAAGALLVKEAGGRIGDLAGGTNFLRTSEVIAASPGVFSGVREAVAAAPSA